MLDKQKNRIRRHSKIRTQVSGTSSRPRLAIFRSNSNIYAQLIDDTNGKTLWATSDLKLKKEGNKVEMSKNVGQEIAKIAKSLKIDTVVFDRGWFAYQWRVQSLADGAREGWLKF